MTDSFYKSEPIQVLDHGYVQLIEPWGSDERIIESARMSTSKGFQGWGGDPCPVCNGYGQVEPLQVDGHYMGRDCPACKGSKVTVGDEKLLRYLWTHKHATPFEMAGMIIEVQAPIFVFREWRTHRTASQFDDVEFEPWQFAYSELSARYTPMPDENYVPSVERIMMSGGTNKQAQSTGPKTTEAYAEDFRQALMDSYKAADALYRVSLGAAGIPKELARLCIPVGRYSRMRATANLRNWLAFLSLRLPDNVQWETRQYANVVSHIISQHFPRTHQLFMEV